MGKFRERIPCKHAGGVIANGAQLHGVCGGPKESELLLRPERVIPGVQSSLFHVLSAVWAFHQNTHPFRKQKRLASFSRDKAFANTLRYHSRCCALAGNSPSQPAATGRCCNRYIKIMVIICSIDNAFLSIRRVAFYFNFPFVIKNRCKFVIL